MFDEAVDEFVGGGIGAADGGELAAVGGSGGDGEGVADLGREVVEEGEFEGAIEGGGVGDVEDVVVERGAKGIMSCFVG
jgi:hypothetical protein